MMLDQRADSGFIDVGWFWGAPQWLPVTFVVGVVLIGLVLWSYRQSQQRGVWVGIAATMKIIGIVLLLVCLLQPMRRDTRPEPRANIFAMLVDDSYSMTVQQPDGRSLAETFEPLMQESSDWKTRLAQDFDLRPFRFDARLAAADPSAAWRFDGGASAVGGALEELATRFADRPVAGALLWSDGNDNGAPIEVIGRDKDVGSYPFPIFPVVTDPNGSPSDVRIDRISVAQSEFETAPMTVRATIATTDAVSQLYQVSWIDPAGNIVEQADVTCVEGQPSEVQFRFRPDESGVQFYRMVVCRDDQQLSASDWVDGNFPTGTDETTWDNNRMTVAVDRRGGPFRVLYVAGRPNWEFKFLRRALSTDAEVQLVGLIRIADKEPKFSFRDAEVRSTNPLFAGLDDAEAELREQIDEPVILRLGVRDSEELSDGFPKSVEELFGYDAVILDDLDASFFTEDQMTQLRRFVSDRGGGVMFLGGQESFDRQLGRTPLADLLPVYPALHDGPSAARSTLEYSREGVLQPWLRLRKTEAAESERMRSLPELVMVNSVGRVKPGGSKLLQWSGPGGESMAAMATQRFGRGRTAALTIGDLWRYQMQVRDDDKDDPRQWWRQMTRWLMSEVPRRVELQVTPVSESIGGAPGVNVQVRVLDEQYSPLENAGVELEVIDSDDQRQMLTVRPSDSQLGDYTAQFFATNQSGYRFVARVTGADGQYIGEAERGWVSDPKRDELRALSVNRDGLQAIADDSGGRLVHVDELDEFVTELSSRPVPIMATWTYPLWHGPWVLMIALACLASEWGLRRWKGCP
ncbi:MAG: hypothetical protein AAF670_15595 [Planctomycetota bacterium]